MSKQLSTYVYVTGEDGFTAVGFGPDDEVPEWAAKQIGDHCWAGDDDGEKSTKPSRKS